MLNSLGFNLNAVVGQFLNPFFQDVPVVLYRYSGMTNNKGERKPIYDPPVTITAKVQVPENDMLQKVNKINDNQIVRAFWVNEEVLPIIRTENEGGDLIWYDNKIWYIAAVPDDYRQVGWMCVLGVMTLEQKPD